MSASKNYRIGVQTFLEDDGKLREMLVRISQRAWPENDRYLELSESGGWREASYDPGNGAYVQLPRLAPEEVERVLRSPETPFCDFSFFARVEEELWEAFDNLPEELFDEE